MLCAEIYEQEEVDKANIKWKLFQKLAIQTLIIFIPERARDIIRLLWNRMFAILLSLSAERILLSSEQNSIVHICLPERNFPQISKIPKIESSYLLPSFRLIVSYYDCGRRTNTSWSAFTPSADIISSVAIKRSGRITLIIHSER